MKPPLKFYLMAHAYDCYGGHSTLSLIPYFLLMDAPDFGPALTELTVTLQFRTLGPPRNTLEQLYADFHAKRLTLPKVVYRRSRQKASIDVASDLIDGSQCQPSPSVSLALFRGGTEETVAALHLLRNRITPKDAFQVEDFLNHCERRKRELPSTGDAMLSLKQQIDAKKTEIKAAMSPWERLGIDWRDFHPDARRILDDPFFWEQANDFAPHGNDTGADLLADYRRWIKRHPDADPADLYQKVLREWNLPPEETSIFDEAAIALAFGELKIRGACRPSAIALAKSAVQRQRKEALAAIDWPHREERLKSLDLIEAKLQSV